MTIYADEQFYRTEYLQGRNAVITTAFPFYAMSASRIIDRYTHGNIDTDNIPDEVKYCACELAEQLFQDADFQAQHGSESSESVQGWTVSYEATEARKSALRTTQKDCINKWLSSTGLLYSGVKPC